MADSHRHENSTESDDLVAKIEVWLADRRHQTLRENLAHRHPADLAAAASGLEAREQLDLLAVLPARLAGRVLEETDDLTCKHLVPDLPERRLASLIDAMTPQAAVSVLEHLGDEARERILASLTDPAQTKIRQRLTYPEDSAGRIMDTHVPHIEIDRRIEDATKDLRIDYGDRESIETIFVVDAEGRLVGQISPLGLLLADPQLRVESLVQRDIPTIPPSMDQEQVANLAMRYDLVALPVVDDMDRLMGVVSFHDIFDVIEEEDVEDLSYAAGTGTDTATERAASRAIRARLPWLIIGLVGGLGSAAVLKHFESALDRVLSLAFFVPVVLGLAGAVAVQSSSLTVRGLASGSVALRRLPKIALRELRVSTGMGVVLGGLLGAAAFASTDGDANLAFLLSLVLVLVLVTAAIGGTLVPIALEKVGIDPAVAMGPFVTTLTDFISLSVYMGIASMLVD